MKTALRTVQHLVHVGLVAAVGTLWLGGTAAAQGEEEEPVVQAAQPEVASESKVSLGAGIDVGSAYFFRGIIQETEGFIGQPFLEGSITLYEADSGLTSASVTGGLWNSMHSGPTGLDGNNADPELWYEADFYTSLALGFQNDVETSLTYTAYMSPNSVFGTVKELAVGFSHGGLPMSPYATLAFEIDGQADGGANEGVYLELGAEAPIPVSADLPVSFSVPVAVGLSLSDYYEHPLSGEDSRFGFFDFGLIASVPLALPAEYGSWSVTGGVKFLVFGDTLETLNGDDSFQPIVVAGVSLSY
ncbi:MAG: hypothetical protein GEU99_13535 [Luteitalea sp.]|nr:hypothetical protein [Luteitalea sp.]